ncbi:unnamed protein product [Linum trigynum]|uniref:Uncharacterized protein n=1 Tax=Linum trigynum TaxID=586398 RepID=A0AAV2EC63_9ROSI
MNAKTNSDSNQVGSFLVMLAATRSVSFPVLSSSFSVILFVPMSFSPYPSVSLPRDCSGRQFKMRVGIKPPELQPVGGGDRRGRITMAEEKPSIKVESEYKETVNAVVDKKKRKGIM